MTPRKKIIWLSYDFGLKGDYTGLYTWLDNMKALECGVGLAYFTLDLENAKLRKTLYDTGVPKYIKKILNDNVKLSKSDRVYIIWRDSETRFVKGKFINGNRKQAPWEGYGKLGESETTDDGE